MLWRIRNSIMLRQTLQQLEQQSASGRPEIRRPAIQKLGEIKDIRAVRLLAARLFSDGIGAYIVEREAREALKQIGNADVSLLIYALKDSDLRARRAAAQVLGDLKDARAVEPLTAALKDPDEDVRKSAAEALGKIKVAEVKLLTEVEPLIVALKDSDEDVRKSAIETLGKIGDARAVEPLIAALKDSSWGVRKAVAKVLGQIGDARAVESLVEALNDEIEYVRESAGKALQSLGWKPKDKTQQALLLVALEEWEKAAILGTEAVEPLLTVLRYEEGAANALGRIGDARAVEPLIAAFKNSHSPSLRIAAAKALVRIGDARAVELFAEVLEVSRFSGGRETERERSSNYKLCLRLAGVYTKEVGDRDVLMEAVKALGQFRDARSLKPLIEAWRYHREHGVIHFAVKVLDNICQDRRWVEPLIAALKDSHNGVRIFAVGALGKIGDTRAVEPLIALLRDSHQEAQGGGGGTWKHQRCARC